MNIFRHSLQLLLLLATTANYYCQAKSLLGGNEAGDSLWKPANRTREEWLNCRGMPKDACARANSMYQRLQKMLVEEQRTGGATGSPSLNNLVPDSAPAAFQSAEQGGCMWLTEEQMDMIFEELQERKDAESGKRRKKRTLIDFKKSPTSKWSLPITYKFDGTHSDGDKKTIRSAFQHWMDNTCVRFNEIPTQAPFSSSHIILTSQIAGCYSYVGKTFYVPQPINLQTNCMYRFGTPVHEIGHALGLYHEQMRFDRDSYINIAWENLQDAFFSQFTLMSNTNGLGLPYNYGSVMQYSSKEAISKNGLDTMIAKQPFYQMNMGQRTGLSFHDAKLMNLAYCQGVCTTPLSQPCQRGGYQNPNDCSRCTCPDGFSGTFCESIAPSKYESCGGTFNIGPNSQQVIASPGYDDRRYYLSKQECTWYFKAPQNYNLQLTFDGDFSVYCEYGACYHWVEVKYKQDLGEEGGRFCCTSRPSVTVQSESNEMMVVFKSNYTVDYFPLQRGFKAIVKTVPGTPGSPTTTTPTRTTPKATTTATTTTTTTTVSSTGAQLRTTPPPSPRGSTLWQCSFDTPSPSGDYLCGMTQDTTDNFDWTVFHDPTPSDPTGPDFPFDGYNYIYIEASSPRMPNDEARLFFPKLNVAGTVCVDFYYHMYGFHINTLKLVMITAGQSTVVWSKSKEVGNIWTHATVGVDIFTNSQLQFIGIRGDEFSGDIGLDKIQVRSGSCPI